MVENYAEEGTFAAAVFTILSEAWSHVRLSQGISGFDPATMPEIPAGFEDRSWHNDGCPSFVHENSASLSALTSPTLTFEKAVKMARASSCIALSPTARGTMNHFLKPAIGKPLPKASLAAEYIALIGYDPFEDEPTETVDGVRERLASYKEARAEDEKPLRAIAAKWVAKFGLGFHPDTRGADYVDSAGACCLTDAEAAEYDADMQTLADAATTSTNLASTPCARRPVAGGRISDARTLAVLPSLAWPVSGRVCSYARRRQRSHGAPLGSRRNQHPRPRRSHMGAVRPQSAARREMAERSRRHWLRPILAGNTSRLCAARGGQVSLRSWLTQPCAPATSIRAGRLRPETTHRPLPLARLPPMPGCFVPVNDRNVPGALSLNQSPPCFTPL